MGLWALFVCSVLLAHALTTILPLAENQ